MHILAHRGNLQGPHHPLENLVSTLQQAVSQGFGLEFDVNTDPENERLVLTHDPSSYEPAKDFDRFLRTDLGPHRHALNVKDLATVERIAEKLAEAGLTDRFFLFDFELLHPNREACRALMRDLADKGFHIAYRLSEREPYFDEYLQDQHIEIIWLDEFEKRWVQEQHVRELARSGKATYYVSPDLHGYRDDSLLSRRWDDLIQWGITGICTDYPLLLQAQLYALSHD